MPHSSDRAGGRRSGRGRTGGPARRPGRGRRRLGVAVAALMLTPALAACGSSSSGPPTLTWYTNPDSGGQAEIAARCTEQAQGQYTVSTAVLPRESSAQREQLVRRLASKDSSIDIMSLDPPYIPEFSQAGFLAPIPADVAERVTTDVVASAVQGSTWNDKLVAVPFWANTQLLWYKKSVAEAAGLDMTKPVTWDQLIDAAQQQKTTLAVQGIRAEALTVFVNALVTSAGGEIIEQNSTKPKDIKLGLESDAGQAAADILQKIGQSGVGGPALSTSGEDANVTDFEGGQAGFMVNWPFVWPRVQGNVESGLVDQSVQDDYGWTVYPRVKADEPSRPPYGGINLGVGAFSKHPDLAYAATECITSADNQKYYFVSNGNPASNTTVYDDPEVTKNFPMAPVIRESLEQAAPRPQTPYYSEISGSLQRIYNPYSAVSPGKTGQKATDLIDAVLAKKRLL